jgi:hemolysin activation/secretion protein
LLTSLEQFALGGPDTVRAYPVGEALVDEVVLMNLEWRARASRHTPLNFLNGLKYLAFFDYARGSLNDPLNNEVDEVKFYDFGFGLEIEPYRKYRASITYAFDLGDEPSENQSLPFYFSLQYDFQ